MRISVDADDVHPILNAPGVLEHHLVPGQEGPLDVKQIPMFGGFFVVGDGAAFVFNKLAHNCYEVHTSILPEKRGLSTAARLQECADIVFTHSDCVDLYTRVPAGNWPAFRAALRQGFVELYGNPRGWGGELLTTLHLNLQTWAKDADHMRAHGEWFHAALLEAGGKTDHEDDPTHDQYVGIAIAMAKAGKPHKAAWFYNIWAGLYGYHPVQLVNDNPVVFDMGSHLVGLHEDKVEVLGCRRVQ